MKLFFMTQISKKKILTELFRFYSTSSLLFEQLTSLRIEAKL